MPESGDGWLLGREAGGVNCARRGSAAGVEMTGCEFVGVELWVIELFVFWMPGVGWVVLFQEFVSKLVRVVEE